MNLRKWLEKGDQPDRYFDGLDAAHAYILRTELKKLFEDAGATIRFEGTSGYVYHPSRGLIRLNLTVLVDSVCERITKFQYTPEDAIAEAAPLFAQAVLQETTIESLNIAELYRGLRLQLQPTMNAAPDELEIIRESALENFTEDLLVGLVFDTEYSIRTVPLATFQEADDVPTLRRAASNNLREDLRRLEVESVLIELPGFGEGGHYYCIESDSSYISSAPLFLEDMLNLWLPELYTGSGVLFSMPHRHMLMVREVTTGQDLFSGINAMVAATSSLYQQAKLPLSQNLHLSYENHIETLTQVDEVSDQMNIYPTEYIMQQISDGGAEGLF